MEIFQQRKYPISMYDKYSARAHTRISNGKLYLFRFGIYLLVCFVYE